MSTFKVAFNPTTKVVKILPSNGALGAGFNNLGSFDHIDDPEDNLGVDENHVFYHHVRDLLEKAGFTSMQMVTITIPATSIDVTPATKTIDLSNGETLQLATVASPAVARVTELTYTSSDPTKATVDQNGKITPKAVGITTITVTAEPGGVTDNCEVTVQA